MLNLATLLELVASLLDAGAAVCAVLLIWKLTNMQLGRVAKQAHP